MAVPVVEMRQVKKITMEFSGNSTGIFAKKCPVC